MSNKIGGATIPLRCSSNKGQPIFVDREKNTLVILSKDTKGTMSTYKEKLVIPEVQKEVKFKR